MLRSLHVVWTSFKMALEELRVNKLRTFLSLFGVTIGILCIIGVLATVQSLEANIRDGLKAMGTNTVFIERWPWGGGGDYPWWKYAKRPNTKYSEMKMLEERTNYASAVNYSFSSNSNIEYKDNILENVRWFSITNNYHLIQDITIGYGRYISESEFNTGTPVCVMGYDNAEKLFDSPERAVGKTITIKGRSVNIVGVIKKQGKSLVGGWDFDNILLMPYFFCRQLVNEENANRFIMVKGKNGIFVGDLKDELKGVMRGIRKLSPTTEDDFALNDISAGSKDLDKFFGIVNIGGFIIGGFSLLVGLFGIANIMFVTVKERTSQIGLKKAIGAKRSTILTEFLLESSFLCLIGGLVGLLLVYLVTKALSSFLPFPIFLSPGIIMLALGISIGVGLLAGFIPARRAARMDPVVAIRSK